MKNANRLALLSVFSSNKAIAIVYFVNRLIWRNVQLPSPANALYASSEGRTYMANDSSISALQMHGSITRASQTWQMPSEAGIADVHHFHVDSAAAKVILADTGNGRLLQVHGQDKPCQILWQARESWQRHINSFAMTPYGLYISLHNTVEPANGVIAKVLADGSAIAQSAGSAAPHDLRYCKSEQKLWWCSACNGRLESLHLPSGALCAMQTPSWASPAHVFAKTFLFLPELESTLMINCHSRLMQHEVLLVANNGKCLASLMLPARPYYNFIRAY